MSVVMDALSTLRGEQRAVNFLKVLRGNLAGDGRELYRVLMQCPADERDAFLRTIQRDLEGRPRSG